MAEHGEVGHGVDVAPRGEKVHPEPGLLTAPEADRERGRRRPRDVAEHRFDRATGRDQPVAAVGRGPEHDIGRLERRRGLGQRALRDPGDVAGHDRDGPTRCSRRKSEAERVGQPATRLQFPGAVTEPGELLAVARARDEQPDLGRLGSAGGDGIEQQCGLERRRLLRAQWRHEPGLRATRRRRLRDYEDPDHAWRRTTFSMRAPAISDGPARPAFGSHLTPLGTCRPRAEKSLAAGLIPASMW